MKQTQYKYLLFFKPYGVLCQFTDDKNEGGKRPTLADYIPISDVYPVGRLDLDSEGLLLLTNNGILQHKLSDPKFAHPRTYLVQVEGIPTEKSLDKLRQGVTIKDYCTRPAKVQLLPAEPQLPLRNPPIRYRQNIPTNWLEITLTEGRNRQVRKMTAAIGYPTLRLVRISLGLSAKEQLSLNTLKWGEWRNLTLEEINIIARLVRII